MVNLWIAHKLLETIATQAKQKETTMGMLSRAQKRRKKEMEEELEALNDLAKQGRAEPGMPTMVVDTRGEIKGYKVFIPIELLKKLQEISEQNEISVERIIEVRMMAYVSAIDKSKILCLHDLMPFGQYRGQKVEDIIRIDARYMNWLTAHSDIFVLDEEATSLLGELG